MTELHHTVAMVQSGKALPASCAIYHLGEFHDAELSLVIAVWSALRFDFVFVSAASEEYPDNEMNPMVPSIARIVITTMSSAIVNQDILMVFLN